MAVDSKIGVLGGTVFKGSKLLSDFTRKQVSTKHGKVCVLENDKIIFIPRHGLKENTPPHKINHHANITALKKISVKHVIGICSVGSLHRKYAPGSIAVPSDYLAFNKIPTFFDDATNHITPSLDYELTQLIVECASDLKFKVFDGGVYVETSGPRLETKAEVRFLSTIGDFVGMTLASEATLAQEVGLPLAGICSVDNYANGVVGEKLDFNEVVGNASENSEKVFSIVSSVAEKILNAR
ncbi:MAG: MTAP family purine nucleoside phosphorylase [Methanobacteriota archaeon]